uniref:NADH dehydrogenase subunit 2 n=1 Tax=Sheathia arcuata TaxID=340433 RepID=A0A343UY11_9FLOR|nr:NADH dehydrogenase subunit 2 [Sheathia arcuata]
MYDIFALFTEIYALLCIIMLLIYGVLHSTSFYLGYPTLYSNIALLCFQISVFSILILFYSSTFTLFSWNQLLIFNSFTSDIKLILLVSFCLWIFLSLPYATYEKLISFEYWILSFLAVVGMLLIVQVCDLLSMYLAIEFQSLIFYILASFKRTSEFSTEAGLKYFILGVFSSALLLFGLSILYTLTGLTNFYDYLKLFSGLIYFNNVLSYAIAFGFTITSISFLFKLSVAPFHIWAPDVYDGAPTITTAFFAIMPKIAILSLFLRFCLVYFHDFFYLWQNMLLFCAFISILFGTFGAFQQKKWKRFIAYSSISHMGFILIGLGIGELESTFGVLLYIIIYIIFMLGIFFILISFRYLNFPNHHQIRYLGDLISLYDTNYTLALSLTLFLFSMAGIPPLLGFFSKIFILLPSVQIGIYSLSIFAVLMSCISCFYYIRLIKIMYFDKVCNLPVVYPISICSSLILGLLVFVSTFLFFDLELLLLFSARLALIT